MIKNKIILILAMLFIFSPFSSLFAVEKATMTTPTKTSIAKLEKEMNDRFMNDIKARTLEIAEKVSRDITSTKIKPNKESATKLQTISNKIYTRLTNNLSKLSIIDSRMSLKMNAFRQEGKDVSKIVDQYDTAKTALIKARVEVLSAKDVAFTQTTVETSKEIMRDLVKTTEESIKVVGEEYRKLLPLFTKLEGDNNIKN